GNVAARRRRFHRGREADQAQAEVLHCRKAQQAKAVARRAGTRRMARTGAAQGASAREGGTSVPGDQAAVWLRESALQRFGEEPCPSADPVRVVEPVDGARETDETAGKFRLMCAERAKESPGSAKNRRYLFKD